MTKLKTPKHVDKLIKAKNENQQIFIDNIDTHAVNFGVGPAGTGKTYLAVYCALKAIQKHEAKKLVFVRPAVEAGEKLGFLPGSIEEKVSPYLRPLYDAMEDLLGMEIAHKWIESGIVEIAPLAFMRGRTLNDSYIILDEAQNTTIEQMKMFITRLGYGSKMVITGDVTQIDLDRRVTSGLVHALFILNNIPSVSILHFYTADIVRNPLITAILNAYEGVTHEL